MSSGGYIANILDRFEHEPDIGMIMPPVVNVGFGTLGHCWFNSFQPLAVLARKMDLKVNYDIDTPLAPLGAMDWFRPDTLFKMFDCSWQWEDYNAEPRPIAGGLAHVQERLNCYVCVDRGYRVVMAMTPEQAGRSFAKLEYKLQLRAARLASGNVMIQSDQLDQLRDHKVADPAQADGDLRRNCAALPRHAADVAAHRAFHPKVAATAVHAEVTARRFFGGLAHNGAL